MKRLILLFLFISSSAGLVSGQFATERSSSLVTIDGTGYYVHTVRQGETLYSLARLYGVNERDITTSNPHIADGLQEGHVVKIPARQEAKTEKMSTRKQQRTFDTHIVNKGETLYSISRRYEIPVTTLLEDNPGLDPSHIAVGQQLSIRKKSRGDATPEQIEEQINDYRDAINSLPTGYVYHVVERGETIFGLSKMYDVTEEDILGANDLADGLKAGGMIRIPAKGQNPLADLDLPIDSLTMGNDDPQQVTVGNKDARVKDFGMVRVPKVALMLPLKADTDSPNRNFVDFYNGFLLGLEDLKGEGISAEVTLYNTSRNASVVYNITESAEFEGTDLIIGPVYEENIQPALQYAQDNSVPIVSPLAAMTGTGSGVLYQMTPGADSKYDKLKQLLDQDTNLVYITTNHKDEEMESEIRPLLPDGTRTVSLDSKMSVRDMASRISAALDNSRGNMFFISCSNELLADNIIASVSSVQNDNIARRGAAGRDIKVVVTSRWARYGRTTSLDRNLYFRLNLCYITNYHSDRGSSVVRGFDRRFISSFGSLPSLYAYRGYDAARLFVGATAGTGSFDTNLNSGSTTLLQMPYRFERTGLDGTMVNQEWALVCYKSNYTINVD